MAISMVISIGGLGLLPASITGYLPPSVTSRPLTGDPATVDLVHRPPQGQQIADSEALPVRDRQRSGPSYTASGPKAVR